MASGPPAAATFMMPVAMRPHRDRAPDGPALPGGARFFMIDTCVPCSPRPKTLAYMARMARMMGIRECSFMFAGGRMDQPVEENRAGPS